MFGYIGPEKNELKVRELAQYQAYYCGLCRAIGRRYAQAARLTLSYDCTFLALLISAPLPCAPCTPQACAYKPFKGRQPVAQGSPALDFTADLNVLLSWYKLRDDWTDERKLRGGAGCAALRGAKEKAARRNPELHAAIERGIAALGALERANCTALDAPADAFARMMRESVALSPSPQTRVLAEIAYHMGRWVYLMDAWDDREKDARSSAYNPFLAAGADAARAGFLLRCSLNEAAKAYALLDVASNKGILDNILYEGCARRTEALLRGGGKHEQ